MSNKKIDVLSWVGCAAYYAFMLLEPFLLAMNTATRWTEDQRLDASYAYVAIDEQSDVLWYMTRALAHEMRSGVNGSGVYVTVLFPIYLALIVTVYLLPPYRWLWKDDGSWILTSFTMTVISILINLSFHLPVSIERIQYENNVAALILSPVGCVNMQHTFAVRLCLIMWSSYEWMIGEQMAHVRCPRIATRVLFGGWCAYVVLVISSTRQLFGYQILLTALMTAVVSRTREFYQCTMGSTCNTLKRAETHIRKRFKKRSADTSRLAPSTNTATFTINDADADNTASTNEQDEDADADDADETDVQLDLASAMRDTDVTHTLTAAAATSDSAASV